jgi:hypothetical protein
MKIFSTAMHGVIDYMTVGMLVTMPRILRWPAAVTQMMTMSAAATFIYSMMTRYELGVFRRLPMRRHLQLDMMSGMLFTAAPLLFRKEDKNVKGLLMGLGLFELFVTVTSEQEPSDDMRLTRRPMEREAADYIRS